ncbi:MAG: glycosyltransferase family 2 protein [Candidatus Micrarchaeia archaeon]
MAWSSVGGIAVVGRRNMAMNGHGVLLGSPYISIVIPTLNEEKNIAAVIKGVKKVLAGYSYEIIIVDGYSKDNTVKIARRLGARVLYDNVGKGSALVKGLRAAKGEVQISMDADMSNKPQELKLLVAGLEAGYDVCMGSRFITGGGSEDMPLIRRFGDRMFVHLVNLLFHAHYTDLCYGYRSFRKGVIDKMKISEMGFGIETEMNIKAIKAGLRILEVPSLEKKRMHGRGHLRTFRDGYIILKTIIRNVFK